MSANTNTNTNTSGQQPHPHKHLTSQQLDGECSQRSEGDTGVPLEGGPPWKAAEYTWQSGRTRAVRTEW